MKAEDYDKAKIIRETIQHMEIKKLQIESMKKRDSDDDFNTLRDLAHSAILYTIERMEEDFKLI